MLLFWCVRVGNEGRASSSLNGLLSHRIVDDISAFSGDFCTDDLPGAIDPNVNHNLAFFTEIIIRAMQALGTTATEVIACAVAFATIAIIFLDASQSIGLALVTRLSSDTFRTASLRVVAALEQGFFVDFGLGFFSGLFLLWLGDFGFFYGRSFVIVLGDDFFLALVLLLLRLGSHRDGRLLWLDVAHALVHHAQVDLNTFLTRQWERRSEGHQKQDKHDQSVHHDGTHYGYAFVFLFFAFHVLFLWRCG